MHPARTRTRWGRVGHLSQQQQRSWQESSGPRPGGTARTARSRAAARLLPHPLEAGRATPAAYPPLQIVTFMPFNTELEMLEVKLMELWDVVDAVIVVESTLAFSGKWAQRERGSGWLAGWLPACLPACFVRLVTGLPASPHRFYLLCRYVIAHAQHYLAASLGLEMLSQSKATLRGREGAVPGTPCATRPWHCVPSLLLLGPPAHATASREAHTPVPLPCGAACRRRRGQPAVCAAQHGAAGAAGRCACPLLLLLLLWPC